MLINKTLRSYMIERERRELFDNDYQHQNLPLFFSFFNSKHQLLPNKSHSIISTYSKNIFTNICLSRYSLFLNFTLDFFHNPISFCHKFIYNNFCRKQKPDYERNLFQDSLVTQ